MKPCHSCPFRPDSLLGLWSPAHYIGIAYLGSADIPGQPMGCHQQNGVTKPNVIVSKLQTCGGWVRAARDSIGVRLSVIFGDQDEAECYDGEEVMDPTEMCRRNGVDVDRLPPLKYDPTRYPGATGVLTWAQEILTLRNRLRDDPESASEFVIPGSPLARGVSNAQIKAALGKNNGYTRRQPRTRKGTVPAKECPT